MDYIRDIENYRPKDEREIQDKKVMLNYIKLFSNDVLLRDNEIAHITSSGFIVNKTLSKALMVHHNIRNVWAWTGGHADGDSDLQAVAAREALEETGVNAVPISAEIASIDILTVAGHFRKGKYINAHLHLSAAYLFAADEDCPLYIKEDENSAVEWFPIEKINDEQFTAQDVYLYLKLVNQARAWISTQNRTVL